MVSALRTDNFPPWAQHIVFRVEDAIWREGVEPDTTTPAFYVYKPYPSSLKNNQIEDWIKVQSRVLSPFSGGSTYTFAGAGGLAFWACPDKFDGIPETALQTALPDGEYTVAGRHQTYFQRWANKTLVECIVVEATTPDISLSDENQRGWAKRHPLGQALQSPGFWAGAMALFAGFMVLWFLVGALALDQAATSLENEAATIESELGDKLQQQSRFQQSQQFLNTMSSWQQQYGYLPQTLSVVISQVIAQSQWRADIIEWQSKKLRVELVSANVDIAALVEALENTGLFSQVSIRPHSNANTWNLEVTVK